MQASNYELLDWIPLRKDEDDYKVEISLCSLPIKLGLLGRLGWKYPHCERIQRPASDPPVLMLPHLAHA